MAPTATKTGPHKQKNLNLQNKHLIRLQPPTINETQAEATSVLNRPYCSLSVLKCSAAIVTRRVGKTLPASFGSDNILTTFFSRVAFHKPVAALWQRANEAISIQDWVECDSILVLGHDETMEEASVNGGRKAWRPAGAS